MSTSCPVDDPDHGAIARGAFLMLGTFSLALGIIGIVIPILPTTPFLLLAAACYARGSKRFYDRLMNSPLFGRYIRDYREGKGVPWKMKAFTLGLLWTSITISALLFVRELWIGLALLAVALVVSAHVINIRNCD